MSRQGVVTLPLVRPWLTKFRDELDDLAFRVGVPPSPEDALLAAQDLAEAGQRLVNAWPDPEEAG